MNELPTVALTQRFLAQCQYHGSQRLAVRLVTVGRSTGVPGLPPGDDWTAWARATLSCSPMRAASRSTTPGLLAPAVTPGWRSLGTRGPPLFASTRSLPRCAAKAWDTKTTEASWRRGFEKYAFPVIGDKPVAAVTVADVREIVVPHWNGRNSTGYTLRQNLEYVLETAVIEKHRLDNPATALKRLLPKVRKVPNHMVSLDYTDVRQAMAEWQALSINPAVKFAVLFIVLTAARLTEATHATWSEIDRPKRVWQVLGRRMKGRRGHDVPLSWQAFELLAAAESLQRSDSLIFALSGSTGVARPPSQGTVSDALRQLRRFDAEGRPITAHGFRTTFRVWQMECAPGFSEAAEIALAHEESNSTKKAYARSELDEQRAKLMQQWANYVLPDGLGDG